MLTDALKLTVTHAPWCLPRPDEREPRMETFLSERTDTDGRVISRPRVVRCEECGEQNVIG